MRIFRALAYLCSLLPLAASAGELGLPALLARLTDLDRLPVLEPGVTCQQFSSYDRASRYDPATKQYVNWSANGDSGHYLRVEPNGEAVMAEMAGPGCIVRIWSANPTGTIRFYLDGAAKPTWEFPFADLFHGKVPPIARPIAGMNGRGANSYLPIPYARSCKVTADKAHRQYYHIGYLTFAKDTPVRTFRFPLDNAERTALKNATEALSRGEATARDAKSTTHDLPAGQTVTLADLDGPGTIVTFRAKLSSDERYALRRVLLRMYWDGETKPSVEAPVGDFFGTGFAANTYSSLPLEMGPDGGTCRWRMPFAQKARIVAVNEGKAPAKLETTVVVRPGPLAPNTARFHAKWRREAPCKTFDYPLLECDGGAGLYLGCALSVDNPDTGWWGEGDEKVYVDGETFPSTFGTGSEDYFGDAWGFRLFIHPFHGCTLGQGPGFSNKWSVYRWHVSDAIPFTRSFRITIENYGRNKDYSSVAYWYQARPQRDFFESVAVAERLPWPRVLKGVVEAEDLKIEGATVIDDADQPEEFSRGKAIALEAERTRLEVPVALDDVYGVVLYSMRGAEHPPFELWLGETRVARVDTGFAKASACALGKVRLAKGTAALTIRLLDTGRLVLDALKLEPSRKELDVLEAESLTILGAMGAEPEVEDVRLPWSGDSQLFLPAPAAGASVTLRLPVERKGRYAVHARLTRGPACGIVQAFLGEQAIGQPVDAWAEKPAAGGPAPIGVAELGPESNALTFKVVGKNAAAVGFHAGIDYLRLIAEVVPNAIEAEGLPRVAVEGGGIGPQGMEAWGAHKWSAGRQLFFRPSDKGAFVTLEVEVKEKGRYALDAYYTRAIDYGIVGVQLDGKSIGEPFDGYHDGVVPSGKVSYGEVELDAGKHRLRFEATGKNPKATGYFMGIDCLSLRPAG